METLKKYKTTLIGLLIVVVLFFVYIVFFKQDTVAPLSATPAVDGGGTSIGGDLVATLLELKSITLDPRLFTDPVFKGLQDFSKEIPPQPVGRVNPFAPLGTAAALPALPQTR